MGYVATPEGCGDDEAVLLRGLGLKAAPMAADVLASAVAHLERYKESLEAFSIGGMADLWKLQEATLPAGGEFTTSPFTHMQAAKWLSRQLAPTE
ncbi:hypothetical protein O2W15_19985 [Modestobacter sp. VKM Ac-2979]|uniref:hypothetical protein n=1 Tax=unclassified Modestobacter TaxID=2643866 RepID=UPI0022AB8585|nr:MULTISPECIES: hypothetical protein [unclassified Modestobacter]MCZ2813716.1 hypothetical protein [Modestobacter sp. VKM Ac-2979]MCZ2844309.1 hypothetical protein [Modestobacter sp. VKM Ac-2980]